MIVGICNRELGLVRVFGDDEADQARAWCYTRKTRVLYEVNGRRVLGCSPAVARQRVRQFGRLLTTGYNGPTKHTSRAARDVREVERAMLREAGA